MSLEQKSHRTATQGVRSTSRATLPFSLTKLSWHFLGTFRKKAAKDLPCVYVGGWRGGVIQYMHAPFG